jgi:hypothetical protein
MSEHPVPRLRTVNRQQIIPAMPLEDLLDSDHQARLVWDFCLGLDLTPLSDQIRSRVGGPGHPAIDPRICVAVWLYATLEAVGSARALAWLCEHHNAFRWLTGAVSVNHHIEQAQQKGTTVYAPVPEPKDPKRDRHEPLPGDSKEIAEWRQRMKTDEAKQIYNDRASTIECCNAQARNRGLIRLLVRGLEQVKAIALWYAIAHNVRRGMSLRGQLALAN